MGVQKTALFTIIARQTCFSFDAAFQLACELGGAKFLRDVLSSGQIPRESLQRPSPGVWTDKKNGEENRMTSPLLLIDSLAAEAAAMTKMPMDTTREVAMYEQGIRLTAQAWPEIRGSYAEESLAEIQRARESGERTAEPAFMARPAEDTRELIQNLIATMLRLPVQKHPEMCELLQFVTNYPDPLMERYYAQKQSGEEQGPALSL